MTGPRFQQFFAEMKRRRVFRVMAVYGIVGFLLLQIVDLAVPALLLPDWTYRFAALILLLGFPVAIVLAWAFEMTPAGVQRAAKTAPDELTEIVDSPWERWLSRMLALAGLIALLAGSWYVGRQATPTEEAGGAARKAPASIAVLPFADMSPDEDQTYFSDGISEELLNLLTKIPELQVAARTSSFSFRNQDLQIQEIAESLNVAHVLEGSVRTAGDEVRITVQLIRAEDGYHMWSEAWNRTLDDIFAIQEEIAADVVAQLKVTLLGAAPTVETTDPEAYALFLQGRHLSQHFTSHSLKRSNALYRQALDIDSGYAAAWAGLADNYMDQADRMVLPFDEGSLLAREAANRALAIDSEYAEAHATLSRIASGYHGGDLAASARHLERALALEPTNPDIARQAAFLAMSLGRLDDAIALHEFSVARDPVLAEGHAFLGVSYLFAGRLDEAIASYRTALTLDPGFSWAQYVIGVALLLKGEPEAALAAMQRGSTEVWRMLGLSTAYSALGQTAEADAELAKVIDKYERSHAYNIAYPLAFRGEADRAFEWLDKAVQYDDSGLMFVAADIQLANLHDDPRWIPFLESLGRSPEQMEAIEFEVQLPQ